MVPVLSAARIADNVRRVRAEIDSAAVAAGRLPESIRLIAVSKTQPVESIVAAANCGLHDFGENTIQESMPKIPLLATRNPEWHFIGHLQSNKARFVPGHFAWLHSLDSVRLAERLERLAFESGHALNVLIEVNIARDPAKSGVLPEQLRPLMEQLLALELRALHLRGLMAIGPHRSSVADRRARFAELRHLKDQCASTYRLPDFSELSSGMSDDFREAILEGSTMVRIGSAIFGERPYADGHGARQP